MTASILIVDDDRSVTTSLGLVLKQSGYVAKGVSSPDEALEILHSGAFDLVLLDMNFSRRTTGEEGLDLLQRIKKSKPALPVILMTAWGSISLAVKGMQAGASDFITKPWTNQQILQSVKTALGLAAAPLAGQTRPLTREELDAKYALRNCVGNDPKLLKVLEIVGRVAPTDASVLITGESGTGKEVLAEALHVNSRRRNGPFVKVNLAGIPPTLFESEMFGHVKGAFTDAVGNRKGRFEFADGGTIFLDEIGDLEPSSQVKMLRVLQDRTYEILGSSTTKTVDVRVISATNRNLAEMVAAGQFREDLLYRLNLISLHLPALRERPDDIPSLAEHFLNRLAQVYQRPNLRIASDAHAWLKKQPWPGNIRQLKQSIERAVLIGGRENLEREDFFPATDSGSNDSPTESLPQVGSMTLDEMEKAMIEKSLRHHGGNLSKVAESLGLTRTSLYRRLEKYGIQV